MILATTPHQQPQPASAHADHWRIRLTSLPIEYGGHIVEPIISFRSHGAFNAARDNVVVVLHPLTGSSDAVGDWWPGLIGGGQAIDTNRYAVIVPDLIGSCHGSAGARVGADDFPPITTRDQARAVAVLLQTLGVSKVALVTGGSLGGMVALELIATFPKLCNAALVFAAPAKQTAWGLGWNAVQHDIVRALGASGLSIARQIAMMTYRTPSGLERRFGVRGDLTRGESELGEWLFAHGERLHARFDEESYLSLLNAMNTHDLSRDRAGVGERLRASGTAIVGVGIPGDQLYPAETVEEWVRAAGGEYSEIESEHGHDAFLIERARVAELLRRALELGAQSSDVRPALVGVA